MDKRRRGEADQNKTADKKKKIEILRLSHDVLSGCGSRSAGSREGGTGEGPSLTSQNGKWLSAQGPPGTRGGRRSADDLPRAEGREKHSSVLWGLINSQRTMSVPRRHKSQPINCVRSAGFTEHPVNKNEEMLRLGRLKMIDDAHLLINSTFNLKRNCKMTTFLVLSFLRKR